MTATRSFETPVTTHSTTRCHNAEHLNPQPRSFNNLKSQTATYVAWIYVKRTEGFRLSRRFDADVDRVSGWQHHLLVGWIVSVSVSTIANHNCTQLSFDWRSWIRASWYNYENNQQDELYRLIYYSKTAVHVSGDVFAHHQEHLTVFTVSGSVHPSCCRQPQNLYDNCFNSFGTPAGSNLGGHYQIL